MRLMYLVHSLDVGGTERLVVDLIQQMRSGVAVSFCCLDRLGVWGEALRLQGITASCLERQPGFDAKAVWRLGQLLRDTQVTILHCHQYPAFFYGACASLFCRSTRIVFTEHGRFYPDIVSPRRRLANRLLVRFADRITSVSQAVRQALITREGIPGHRVEIIHNGVAPERFAASPATIAAVRSQLRIQDGAVVIGTVGRLDPIKDHEMLLEAFRIVHTSAPKSRLLIIGDGETRPVLEQKARDLGLHTAVLFVGFRMDVPQLLAACDVFALSSRSEGMPVTILEAMAAGIPVVATSVGDNPHIVVDGITGIIRPPVDPAPFAAALISLIRDPDKRRQMGRAGRDRVLLEFTTDRMVGKYRELYHAVTQEGRVCAASLAS